MTTEVAFIPRCVRCAGTEDLIEGDSAIVCKDCVRVLGGIANDPSDSDQRILTELLRRHGDVVALRRSQDVRGKAAVPLRWEWTASWPGVEPRA